MNLTMTLALRLRELSRRRTPPGAKTILGMAWVSRAASLPCSRPWRRSLGRNWRGKQQRAWRRQDQEGEELGFAQRRGKAGTMGAGSKHASCVTSVRRKTARSRASDRKDESGSKKSWASFLLIFSDIPSSFLFLLNSFGAKKERQRGFRKGFKTGFKDFKN
jgi:hypothetical protein